MPHGVQRRQNKRVYLGRTASGIGHVARVYSTREALEVDEVEGYDVTRRRVFYDDVLLVTRHDFVGAAFVVILGTFCALLSFFAWLAGREDRTAGFVLLAFALPFLIAIALRLVLKVTAITVFGRRTRAQIHFWFRKGRARDVFNQICRAAREAQRTPSVPSDLRVS